MRGRQAAAGIAMGGIITYHTLLFILIGLRPDLDPYWHTISEWAIGPWGWVMTSAFIIAGLSYAALFFAIAPEVRGWWGYLGLFIFGLSSVGLIGVGAFTMDPMTTPPEQLTVRGILHILFGMTQMVLLPLAALLLGLNLTLRNEEWAGHKKAVLIVSILPLAGFIGFIVHLSLYVIPLGNNAYGPDVPIGWPPRILFLTYAAWFVTVAMSTMKVGAVEAQRYYFENANARVNL